MGPRIGAGGMISSVISYTFRVRIRIACARIIHRHSKRKKIGKNDNGIMVILIFRWPRIYMMCDVTAMW